MLCIHQWGARSRRMSGLHAGWYKVVSIQIPWATQRRSSCFRRLTSDESSGTLNNETINCDSLQHFTRAIHECTALSKQYHADDASIAFRVSCKHVAGTYKVLKTGAAISSSIVSPTDSPTRISLAKRLTSDRSTTRSRRCRNSRQNRLITALAFSAWEF